MTGRTTIEATTVDVPRGSETVPIRVITLTGSRCRAVVTELGARLLELHVPDRDGVMADVVLGRPSLADCWADETYMGATAGRYANRIRAGRFELDGHEVGLARNEGANHLHGGAHGFDGKVWSAEIPERAEGDEAPRVSFRYVSPAGEEGYPGTLSVEATYRLEGSTLAIDVTATTDAPTVANIVNHTYLNLAGHASGTIAQQLLQIHGSFYTPVDAELLPTGEILSVVGTPFDFRTPTPIGAELERAGPSGYDHNWVLDGVGLREVLVASDPASGRRLHLSTNQPGVQMYSGGKLAGTSAKGGVAEYPAFAGFTIETQTFPGAANVGHFPSARLDPGQTYLNAVTMAFDAT